MHHPLLIGDDLDFFKGLMNIRSKNIKSLDCRQVCLKHNYQQSAFLARVILILLFGE